MIYLQNLQKQFGKKVIFNDVSFHLRPGEKVGLIGENGMGKTTLFRVIVGEQPLDAGQVILRKGAKAALLAQELVTRDETILERVVMGDPEFGRVKRQLELVENDETQREKFPNEWGKRYGDLHHDFERLGGYEREARAKAILSGLGFKEGQWSKALKEFSGGWRMRVELALLLLQSPDVLLLDEPTNHLDLKSVVWLEGFLKTYEGSVLLISHDRRFLNGLVSRIAELDRGALTAYTGNYDIYEVQKAEREEQLIAQAANQQRRVAEIERFVERFRAKNTKATQVQSRIKMLNKMEKVETATRTKSVHFRFPQPARTGRIVMELKDIDKSYGPVQVYKNFSIQLERGWRVALVGENGAGKSTLLKLLAGVVGHDKGEVRLGANVTRAYYAQHHAETLNPGQTVYESLDEAGGHLMRTQKHSILGAFLFSGDDVDKKVSILSGGERSRLSLARMLTAPTSLILLDEPTNHLDMRSTEFLAAALADFEGSLCTISHDREFLDGIINRVWEVDNGKVKEYVGNYSEYEWAKEKEAAAAELKESSTEPLTNSATQNDKDRKRQEAEERNKRHRLLKPLKDKLQVVEKNLEEIMHTKSKVELELADPGIYQEDQKSRLLQTLDQQKKLASEENGLLGDWEEISSRIEEVSSVHLPDQNSKTSDASVGETR